MGGDVISPVPPKALVDAFTSQSLPMFVYLSFLLPS